MSLEECGIKDGSTIMVDIVEKILTQTAPKAKKPSKEEQKVELFYTIRTSNRNHGEDADE